MKHVGKVWGGLIGSLLFFVFTANVAAACGDITYTYGSIVDTQPIEDCDNPFGPLQPNNDLALYFGDTRIEAGGTYELVGQTASFSVENIFTTPYGTPLTIYQHTDNGYSATPSWVRGPTPEPYVFTAPGTYTVYIEELGAPILTWQQQLRNIFIPTAHAAEGDRTAITFTVTEPEQTGASSVLFLPGIQASRLYTTEDASLQKRWEPYSGNDVRALAMDEDGNSQNVVTTNDVIDRIPGLGSVYSELLDHFDALVAENVINDYEPYAYDWRYSVFDVVENGTEYFAETKYLNMIVTDLAADSKTGKVTIVAHSNGGLLAKALIAKLESEGSAHLIDNLIMVGTPQLGTPKAIASLLHGTGQGIRPGGLITLVSEETAREVARNTPGAYGLLPTEEYLNVTSEPLVEFIFGESTNDFINLYGNTLEDIDELDTFLTDTSGGRENAETAAEALSLNQGLLDQARQQQSFLDGWQPPANVQVHSLVGVGWNTISGLRYESFTERNCTLFVFCQDVELYKPVPRYSRAGDNTVMAASAAGNGDWASNYYVDLDLVSQLETDRDIKHFNLTESSVVQEFITNILAGTSTETDLITRVEPSLGNEYLLLGAHSPVYMYIQTTDGRIAGQIDANTVLAEIPEVQFDLLGNSRYITAPKDLDFTVHITGYADGGMTFTVSDLAQPDQPITNRIPISVVTASTTITLEYSDKTLSNAAVDEDGDGVEEYELTPDGDRVAVEPTTYSEVREYITANLETPVANFVVGLLNLSERFSLKEGTYARVIEYRLLSKLQLLVQILYQEAYISETDNEVLLEYVKKLEDNLNL